MSFLEEEGFLAQPHVSAGRIPTAKGYRVYVEEFMKPTVAEKSVRKKFDSFREQYFRRKDQERVYDAVTMLSRMVQNIGFATVPHRERVYYLGLANVLKQPEFQENPLLGSGIVEVLEGNLTEALSGMTIDSQVRCYIGEENLLPQIQSCSLIVKKYRVRDSEGVIGILGPLRMDYAYNTVALDMVSELLSQ